MTEKFNLFDKAASHYDRGRPDYPSQAIKFLIHSLDIIHSTKVLDVASGTGKLAKKLAETQAKIVAYDKSDQMLDFIRQANLENIEVIQNNGDYFPFVDSSFDAITVGQAMHWFDLKIALPEFHRVLRPSGRMALIWNKRDTETDLFNEIEKVTERYRSGSPNWMDVDWKMMIDDFGLFTPMELKSFSWERKMDRSTIMNGILSRSYISNLATDTLDDAVKNITELVESYFEKTGLHQIIAKYSTVIYWAEKR